MIAQANGKTMERDFITRHRPFTDIGGRIPPLGKSTPRYFPPSTCVSSPIIACAACLPVSNTSW